MGLLSFILGLAFLGFSGFVLWLFFKATLFVAWIGDNVTDPLVREIATVLVYLVCFILGPLIIARSHIELTRLIELRAMFRRR